MSLDSPDPRQDIPTRFRYLAARLPDRPAAVDADGETTYAALDSRSDQLAAQIARRFGKAPEPVGLLFPFAASAAIGMLGVLKAGKFCVSLDPLAEIGSLRATLQASAASILLTCANLLPLAQSIAFPETQTVNLDLPEYLEGDRAAPAVALTARSFGTLSFSSGSTGAPKGILRDHAGLLNAARLYQLYDRIGPGDRLAQISPPAYVHYSTVTLGALLNGATLCYCPTGTQQLHGLFDWVRAQAITVLSPPSSLMRDLLASGQSLTKIPSVRVVMLVGQSIRGSELARLRELLSPDCVVTNRLTMTEISSITRYVVTPQDLVIDSTLPAGYACDGNTITLLDENNRPVPHGEIGQIVVKSRYVSPGYWRNPELTASRILPDPAGGDERLLLTGDLGRIRSDGALEWVGRKDFQVKIRGHRVEPEAIENVLSTHSNVRECVVVARPNRIGEAQLIAYLAPRAMPAPAKGELREQVSKNLPAHMIPARFVILEHLPHSAAGKIDRQALPPPGRARPELRNPFVPPQSELETKIANVWCELLELDEVGLYDNFFELGGDSLSAMLMILETEGFSKQPIPPGYFASPTIASLARYCQSEAPTHLSSEPASRAHRASPAARSRTRNISSKSIARKAIHYLLARMPYAQGLHWLAWIGQPAIARKLFREEYELFCQLAQVFGNPGAATDGAFQASVMGNMVWQSFSRTRPNLHWSPDGIVPSLQTARELFWRSFASCVGRAKGEEWRRLIVFNGLERFYHAHRKRRGVILVTYHSPATPLANAILSRYANLGHISTVSHESARQLAEREEVDSRISIDNRRSAWSARFALEGQRVLKQGGVVQVVNDVTANDDNSIRKSIGGRTYDLKPGFAELALRTGAAVLPVYHAFDATGRVHMSVLPALARAGSTDHLECVDHLLDQYVAFTENVWREKPESIGWGALRRYFSRPLFSDRDAKR